MTSKERDGVMSSYKRLKLIAPIGKAPAEDKELRERLEKLPPNATLSEIFNEISEWEDGAVIKDKLQENTEKSGKLIISCQ